MTSPTSLGSKVISGFFVAMLFAAPASSADYLETCVDISTPSAHRIMELIATPVNDKYYSLSGSQLDASGTVVGSAVGTGLLTGDDLICTVNASSASGTSMNATLFQFNIDAATTRGTFKSITQFSVNGTTSATSSSGEVAFVPCEDPLTVFNPTTPPVGTCIGPAWDCDGDGYMAGFQDCDDQDPNIHSGCVGGSTGGDVDKDGYTMAQGDCNDSKGSIHPGATDACGNGVDENCDGSDLVCPNTYATFTVGTGAAAGTLRQNNTGLVWQQVHRDPAVLVNWFGAKKYCEDLSLGGYSDWRLPTSAELEGIVDDRMSPVMIDPLFTAAASSYWTGQGALINGEISTVFVYDVDFETGVTEMRGVRATSDVVRCVRGQ